MLPTKACTNLLAKLHSARWSTSANFSSQVTVSAYRKTNPPTDLSFKSTKNDISQSNLVEHSKIWQEISRSRRDKKDGVEQIWVELVFCRVQQEKPSRAILLARTMIMMIMMKDKYCSFNEIFQIT